jgi:tRNA-dihydrouridine synthase 2
MIVQTGTIQYVKGGKTVLQVHPREKQHLVFQLGTADPELALQAALHV